MLTSSLGHPDQPHTLWNAVGIWTNVLSVRTSVTRRASGVGTTESYSPLITSAGTWGTVEPTGYAGSAGQVLAMQGSGCGRPCATPAVSGRNQASFANGP